MLNKPHTFPVRPANGQSKCACISLQVYFYCSLFKNNVDASSLNARQKAAVNQCMRERWDYLHSDLHGAAFCMDPEFWDLKLNSEVSGLQADAYCSLMHITG